MRKRKVLSTLAGPTRVKEIAEDRCKYQSVRRSIIILTAGVCVHDRAGQKVWPHEKIRLLLLGVKEVSVAMTCSL